MKIMALVFLLIQQRPADNDSSCVPSRNHTVAFVLLVVVIRKKTFPNKVVTTKVTVLGL